MLFRGFRWSSFLRPALALVLAASAATGTSASAQSENPSADGPGRALQLQATTTTRSTHVVKYRPSGSSSTTVTPLGRPGRTLRGPGCSPVVTSLANGFDNLDVGGEITIQAGMVEQEGFGQTYIVPDPDPSTPQNEAFPITVDLIEFVVATVGTVSGSDGQAIKVGYSIEVYDGEPVSGNFPVFTVSSTNDPGGNPDLPTDIELQRVGGSTCQPCATSGLSASVGKVQFFVDSADPDELIRILGNDQAGGVATGRFTIMVRLTRMHDATPYGECSFGLANECGPLNRCVNGFMATEANNTGTLNFSARNWISIRECGPLACAGGVYRFSQLSAGGGLSTGCRPSRDTLIQTTYTPAICTVASQGACCAASGACTITSSAACTGAYQGNGAVCGPNPCPQPDTGACCTNGVCTVTTETPCINGGGVFQGPATTCAGVTCPAAGGACCGTLSGLPYCGTGTQAECALLGGVYQGNGTVCQVQPPFDACGTGACCASNGTCTAAQTAAQCTAQGGTYKGNNSTCTPGLCPTPSGACCISGACLIRTPTQCAGFPGAIFQGGGTVCDPNPCAQAGVCCRGTTCAIGITQGACTSPGAGVGAFYATSGASGGCNTANNSSTPCCYADFDKANGVAIDDLFLYLNAYFTSSPWAKIGGDGTATPTIDDLFKYINAYFTGCG